MTDFAVARRRMVREQLEEAGLTDRRVLKAMREVPRHLFVPRLLRHRAHQPGALPIGYGQTISKPFTVGLMSQLMELQGDEHVLEIGTGSGYQAAVLARLAGTVVSVERIRPLATRARQVLTEVGAANVTVLPEDGTDGWLETAPYDAIMVTACAPHLPPLLLGQLREGGRLLIPVSKGREQILYRYRRQGQEVLVEQSLSCRFVPLLRGTSEPIESPVAESEPRPPKEMTRLRENLLQLMHHLPPPVAVFCIAMLPVFELRGAIPAGFAMGMDSVPAVYLLAVAGNFVPVLPIMLLLGPAERSLRRFGWADRFLTWLFKRTVSRSDLIKRYESLGLILFVAIPAPMTGAWTGAIAAYLFKLPLRMAVPCIILGILIAGIVVTLVSQGVIHLWQ